MLSGCYVIQSPNSEPIGANVKIELDSDGGTTYRIDAYSAGSVVIGEQHYNTSLIVSPDQVISDWAPEAFDDLAAHHMETLAAMEPEIIVIGTGQRLRFPSAEVLTPLLKQEIGYEIMDTGAACRCYNILVGEGRRVIAALLMIEEER